MSPQDKMLRLLLSFFALPGEEQVKLFQDFEVDQLFDLHEGHLHTKYKVKVLLSSFISYTKRYYWLRSDDELGSEWENVEEKGMDALSELAGAIQLFGDECNRFSSGADKYWQRDNLMEKPIWEGLRVLVKHVVPAALLIPLSKDDITNMLYCA